MGRLRTLRMLVAVAAAACLASSCGAGLIAGIVGTSDGKNPSAVRPPELTLSPVVPLVPPDNATRTVLIANAQIAAAARLRVRIDAAGVAVEQGSPFASGQGGSTLITFTLVTAPILATGLDPTAADVPGLLSVFVDDRSVATPVAIVLARQPRAELELPPNQAERLLSPFGERVQIRVDGLRSTLGSDLQVSATTRDPTTAGAFVTRLASDVRLEPADGGAPLVSATVPGNTFPDRVELVVVDAIAGQSTKVVNAYYRPDVALALPGQGPTTGGSLVTLIGTALLPYDFATGASPAPFAFDRIELAFAKGGRITPLPPQDFRPAESASDRLVFTVPPAPDGRPGQVDIVLRVRLGEVTAVVSASQVFLFANRDPVFGPRGAVLDRLPVAIAPIALDQAPSTTAAPDFAVLTDQGGVGFLQLLLSQQNGMFQPFGSPRQIGDHENAAERGPRDLCVGDFDGDDVPDVFIANQGALTAVHHLVLGQAAPKPPLGSVHPVSAQGGTYKCVVGSFDGDALPDVLLVPGPTAAPGSKPHVLLARPAKAGAPAFASPIDLPVRDFPFEACAVADLDGDGKQDVAVVSGTQGKLDVAYGIGDGTFTAGEPLDFTVPGYVFDALSPAVGLHACADGPWQSLALVLAGIPAVAPQPTPPAIVVMPALAARQYELPQANRIFRLSLPGVFIEAFGRSLVADVDGAPPVEMVVSIAGEAQFLSLGLLQLVPGGGFEPFALGIEGAVQGGAEPPRQIRALAFARAFPATQAEGLAVFLVHETEIDGVRERRLSTRLVRTETPGEPRLLAPDAVLPTPYSIDAVVGGSFYPTTASTIGASRDLALARAPGGTVPSGIALIQNNGIGGFPFFGSQLDVPGLLPASLTLLPSPPNQIDRLLFCDRSSGVGMWRHVPGASQHSITAATAQLRALVADPALAATDLANTTGMRVADVDGDGIVDLVVMMTFALANPGEGQAAIALLRGKTTVVGDEFPFHVPTAVTPVHGNASSLQLGDFTNNGAGQRRILELAVAVPVGSAIGLDGDHVRFFRYQAGAMPADDRFVPAAAPGGPQVLLAGSNPTRLAVADFDRNGLDDLLVGCRGDNSLRLFRNTAGIGASATAVDVGAFEQALGSPWQLAVGFPTNLLLSDVNGDGNVDAVTFVEFTSAISGQLSTTVGIYLSSGDGSFDGPRYVSPTRIGDRDGHLGADIGDWNRDGLPDLFLGWDFLDPGLNLRVLFGGTK